MNDTQLVERLTKLIDDSAPPLSLEQVIARQQAADLERRPQLSPRLVIAFSLSVVVLIAAVVVVGVALRSANTNPSLPFAGGGSGRVSPLPDTSLTPSGWAPLELGDVQVSVPGTWSELVGAACPGTAPQDDRKSDDPGCRAAYVTMQSSSKKAIPNARSAVVNGISVILGSTGHGTSTTYIERALGTEIEAEGTLAEKILGTLTYSPLSVLLDSTIHGSPAAWRTITYDGLSFRVPRSLKVAGSGPSLSCPLYVNTVELVSAKAAASGECGYPGTSGRSVMESEGFAAVSISALGTGSFNTLLVKKSVDSDQCVNRRQLKICFTPPAQQQFETVFGILSDALSALVVPSDGAMPVILEIGLPESGLTALEIFDSFRPAGSSKATQPSSTVPRASGGTSTATTVGRKATSTPPPISKG